MSEFREPLHQPPNPADLQRVPPGSPDCARVRGWLRDFADNDLDPVAAKRVEEHVHRCRTCAVELSRAEHEVLRVRSALTRGVSSPALPEDFAARVVERLVLDETSMVSSESLKQAAEKLAAHKGANGASAAGATNGGQGLAAGRKRSLRVHPAVMLFGAMLMLWGLAFGVETFGVRSTVLVPVPRARIVVIAAKDASGPGGLLGPGSGLGENEWMHVGRVGLADLEWHDAMADKTQPAARIRVHADGDVGLENGVPRIYGHVDIQTSRPVSLPMADGSRLEFGIGEYALTASLNPGEDPVAATPKDLLVQVEVKSGGNLTISRSGGSVIVVGGHIGIYQGTSETAVVASGGNIAKSPGPDRQPMEVPVVPSPSFLIGYVRDYTGAAVPDSYVGFAYSVSGAVRSTGQYAGVDGRLQLELPGKVDNGFAVVNAVAAPWRPDLGVLVPDAMRLQGQGPNEVLAPLVFEASTPFAGAVRDELGNPLQGVRVVPCVVDELFGKVWPLPGADVASDDSGRFACTQLPARLPPHESLCLLLLYEGMAPTTVAIPERGCDLALVEFPPITMRRVQFVGLHHLLPNAQIEILEEIQGLPGGAAVVRRTAASDNAGAVAQLAIGWGPLWVREASPAGPIVKRLVMDQYTGMQQYRPSAESFAWRDQFQTIQTIPGTTVQVASSHRFSDFVSGRSETGGWTSVGTFISSVGYPVVAQVFSVEGFGARGRNAHFLGFTAANGTLSLPVGESDRNLVAITPDGSCAMVLRGPSSAGTTTIDVVPTGRAVLDVSLRPPVGGPEVVPIRFHRIDVLPGLAPEAIRFAGPSTEWEVRDLLPGSYEVYVGTIMVPVVVPSTGWAVIH